MASGKEESRLCGMSRSALTSFPVQVKQGLLWVYPYMGPEAQLASKRTQPCVTPECEGAEWVMTTAPVGFQVSLENSFDPSHAPFVHHGIAKYSPDRAARRGSKLARAFQEACDARMRGVFNSHL